MGIAEKISMPTQKQEWWAWHKQNPHVWGLFEKFTFEAINAGHERLSAWFIVNQIRWETTVKTTGKFKIKNEYIAYYARLFMAVHPQYSEPKLFTTKRMRDE